MNNNILCRISEEAGQIAPALLVPFGEFIKGIGFLDLVASHLELDMQERRHTIIDKVASELYSIVTGCEYNKDIDIKLRPNIDIAKELGQEQFPDQSGINRFLRRFDSFNTQQLELIHEISFKSYSLTKTSGVVVVDLDGVGLLATPSYPGLNLPDFTPAFDKGHIFARRGYFANHQGKTGYQLALSYCGKPYHEVICFFFDPGNVKAQSRFYDLYYQTVETLSDGITPVFRFDGGINSGERMQFLIDENRYFVSKGNCKHAKKLARGIPEYLWHWVSPNQQAADAGLQKVRNCRPLVRIIVLRSFRGNKVIFSEIITNIPEKLMSPEEVVNFYNSRQTIESWVKEARGVLHFDHLRTTSFVGILAFLHLVMLAQNLLTWFWHSLFGDTELADAGLKMLVRFMCLPAKVEKTSTGTSIELLTNNQLARILVKALHSITREPYFQLSLPFL